MPITVSGTTITFNDATTQTTAGKSGTVTSVATGNGLSGGTITTTGTLVVACPTYNSVGSYCFSGSNNGFPGTFTSGSNYSAGTGNSQVASQSLFYGCGGTVGITTANNLSGTWKWMASTKAYADSGITGLACRVS